MQYSKYIGAIIRDHGVLQLNASQHRRLLNISSLEGRIHSVLTLKDELVGREKHKYDMWLYKLNKQLTELTGNLTPQKLLEEMIWMSK